MMNLVVVVVVKSKAPYYICCTTTARSVSCLFGLTKTDIVYNMPCQQLRRDLLCLLWQLQTTFAESAVNDLLCLVWQQQTLTLFILCRGIGEISRVKWLVSLQTSFAGSAVISVSSASVCSLPQCRFDKNWANLWLYQRHNFLFRPSSCQFSFFGRFCWVERFSLLLVYSFERFPFGTES